MSFLKAEWRKLILVNYEVEPEMLEPYVPYGTVLDLWQDRCYVSLVGFMFLNTKLLGLPIPGHINFEEVNLRFYVTRKHNNLIKRGVVFIKEIVPKPALTIVANTVYKEHYETMQMDHEWKEKDDWRSAKYMWRRFGEWNTVEVRAERETSEIEEGSEAEFITEHYWGYAKAGEKKTNEYEVTHPRWQQYKVKDYELNVDFGNTYGDEWSVLNETQSTSVMLAEGSEITVEKKIVLKI